VVNPGPFRDGSYAYIMVDTEVRQVAIRNAHEDLIH
jgi:Icc-related predicted phosphoesterase